MPRYETGDSRNPRFWEITVQGTRIVTRTGSVGSDGKLSEPKDLGTQDAALKEVEKRVRGKLKQGFKLVDDDTSGMVQNPALEQAIAGNPDDDGPYLVYGDWLQSQGDPRGELVAVQRERANAPEDKDLLKKEDQLIARVAPARVWHMHKKKRGANKAASGYTEIVWRLGFIDRARIARNSERPPHTVRELTAALLAHPAARVLRCLHIGALAVKGSYHYEPVIEEIRQAAPAALRELFIADFDITEHADLTAASLGDISGLYPVLPRLETLHLRAGSMGLGEIALPELRSLTITTNVFDETMILAVANARAPRLERLALIAGGTSLPMAAMARLVHARAPALRELALVNTDDTGEMWRGVLRDSALLSHLRTLNLSTGSLGDSDAREMLRVRHQLEHLEILDLEANHLSEEAAEGLLGICPDVRVANQRPPRAIQISEQQIAEFAPDAKSIVAARKIANPDLWFELGQDGTRFWGRCLGSRGNSYNVYADMDGMDAGCTCPSQKYPCKHAIALFILADAHPIELYAPPPGFYDEIDEVGYDNIWE